MSYSQGKCQIVNFCTSAKARKGSTIWSSELYDYEELAGQRTLESNDEIEQRGTEGTDATATAIWAIKGLDGGPTIHRRRPPVDVLIAAGTKEEILPYKEGKGEREGYQFDPRKHQQCPRGEQKMDGDDGGADEGGKKGEETDT